MKDGGDRYGGFYAALPDAVTAGGFALVWMSPFVFGPLSVKTAMLTMLVEFFLVHATGFFTAFGNDQYASRRQRVAMLLGLSLFYVLMIPSADTSWVYDASLPPELAWHERAVWNPRFMRWQPYRAHTHVFAFDKHIVGDRLSGAQYELRTDLYDEEWAT